MVKGILELILLLAFVIGLAFGAVGAVATIALIKVAVWIEEKRSKR